MSPPGFAMVDRFKLLKKKKVFIQKQIDIASDVRQKFTMKKQLNEVENEISELMEKFNKISESQEASKDENNEPDEVINTN